MLHDILICNAPLLIRCRHQWCTWCWTLHLVSFPRFTSLRWTLLTLSNTPSKVLLPLSWALPSSKLNSLPPFHHRDYCHSCCHITIIYSCSLSSSWRRGCEMHLRGCWPDGRANTGFTTTMHHTRNNICALCFAAPCTMHNALCSICNAPYTTYVHHAPCTMYYAL